MSEESQTPEQQSLKHLASIDESLQRIAFRLLLIMLTLSFFVGAFLVGGLFR